MQSTFLEERLVGQPPAKTWPRKAVAMAPGAVCRPDGLASGMCGSDGGTREYNLTTHRLTIDLLTERPSDGAFILGLVEEGPWDSGEIETQLRRIQDRLYNCVDVAVDGHLAAKYPDSRGKPVIIRLDCYDTPDQPVRDFFQRFAEHTANSKDVQKDLAAQGFVQSIGFEYNWRTLKKGN